MPRKKQHYVDNEKFLEVMTEYRNAYLESKENGEEQKPMIPDYAGECFLKIAERLSHRPNFINYAFREEMVSDGIENCVMYASNFDHEKSSNPFAYFTQIIYYAFLRRIQKEKKQLYIKHKAIENFQVFEENIDPIDGSRMVINSNVIEPTEYMKDFVQEFEKKEKENKVKKEIPPRGVEVFYKEK